MEEVSSHNLLNIASYDVKLAVELAVLTFDHIHGVTTEVRFSCNVVWLYAFDSDSTTCFTWASFRELPNVFIVLPAHQLIIIIIILTILCKSSLKIIVVARVSCRVFAAELHISVLVYLLH